jgi:plastocyanin
MGIMLRVGMLAAAALAAAACNKESPTDPTDPPCATITIANNAVSPNAVTVSPGCRVMFVNNDAPRNHDMSSDPHPEHTDCREINSLGVLPPGRSGETGNLNTVRACGFHDHLQDQVASLKGTITIR